jgi:hypothetical protein
MFDEIGMRGSVWRGLCVDEGIGRGRIDDDKYGVMI